jgi:low temperature requirement protein LtrA
VLGESVLAIAAGTAGTDWALDAVLTGVFGFVAAACIWWLYFDHVGSAGLVLGPRTAFYWGYGHLAVYAGIARCLRRRRPARHRGSGDRRGAG